MYTDMQLYTQNTTLVFYIIRRLNIVSLENYFIKTLFH